MKKTAYVRDKRSPTPKNENVSKIMRQNKAKNSKPELIVRNALWNNGYKGYRIHPKNLPGKPDILFVRKKLAIFINGCFWHRCPYCSLPLPKNNTIFWKNKFIRNEARDLEKKENLEALGYMVITMWECKVKNKTEDEILNYIETLKEKYVTYH